MVIFKNPYCQFQKQIRCVAYAPVQICTRLPESFMITLYYIPIYYNDTVKKHIDHRFMFKKSYHRISISAINYLKFAFKIKFSIRVIHTEKIYTFSLHFYNISKRTKHNRNRFVRHSLDHWPTIAIYLYPHQTHIHPRVTTLISNEQLHCNSTKTAC